jgi:hypothetical protein
MADSDGVVTHGNLQVDPTCMTGCAIEWQPPAARASKAAAFDAWPPNLKTEGAYRYWPGL